LPYIGLYLDQPDLSLLQDFLNHEDEILFVMPAEPGHYAIADSVTLEPNAVYTLWHAPSGEIPDQCRDRHGRIVSDPWRVDNTSAFRLTLEVCPGKYQQLVPRSEGPGFDLQMFEDPCAIGRSGFEWLGNKYRPIGTGADPKTERWWQRLRRWVAKHGRKVTWTGPLEEPASELRLYAFPFAYAAFKNGRPRSINPVLLQMRSR
jgi:hypothetical protein